MLGRSAALQLVERERMHCSGVSKHFKFDMRVGSVNANSSSRPRGGMQDKLLPCPGSLFSEGDRSFDENVVLAYYARSI